MVKGTGPGQAFEAYLVYADNKRLPEWSPKDDKHTIRTVAAECECGEEFQIIIKKQPYIADNSVMAEVTLDGRSIGLDWGRDANDDEIELDRMPVKEEGRNGQYALVFGAMPTAEDLSDADIKQGLNKLSRVVISLYAGRWCLLPELGKRASRDLVRRHTPTVKALGTVYEKANKLGTTVAKVSCWPGVIAATPVELDKWSFSKTDPHCLPFYSFHITYGPRPALVRLKVAPPLPPAPLPRKQTLNDRNPSIAHRVTAGRIVNDDTDVDEDDEMTLSELEDAEANLAERERNRIERERLARMRRQMSKRGSGGAVTDKAGAVETGRKRKKLAEVIEVSG